MEARIKPLLAVDVESTGLHLHHGAMPYFLATCDEQGNQRYWEWDVDPLTRKVLIPKRDIASIQRFFKGKRLLFHHASFDLLAMTNAGLDVERDFEDCHDTMIMHHCLESGENHGLKELSVMHLDLDDLDERELEQNVKKGIRLAKKLGWKVAKKGEFPFPKNAKTLWKADLWILRALAKHHKYPADHPWWSLTRRYGLRDPERTMMLYFVLKEALEEEGLYHLYDERRKLIAPVRMMQKCGVTCNVHLLDKQSNEFQTKATHAGNRCLALAKGAVTNLGSQNQLRAALYGPLRCPVVKETKTGPSTDREALEAILGIFDQTALLNRVHAKPPAYYFIKSLQKYRRFHKASEYADEYRRKGLQVVGHDDYIRLYPTFNIIGPDTTRFSSQDPNQQNVSKQEDTNLRKVFMPLPGRSWFSLDYSNIELRIFAYASGDRSLIEAFETGYSVHLIFCKILWPKEFAECEKKGLDFKTVYESTLYQWCKNGNFSLIYGAGATKANATYRHPQAYQLIRKNLRQVDRFIGKMHGQAIDKGYVECIGGYRLQVPRNEPHKASNYFVQGSAGWALILAMNRVYQYLKTKVDHHLTMCVHDELDFDFPTRKDNPKTVYAVQEIMEQSGNDLGFELPVKPEWHRDSWAEGLDMSLFTAV